MPKWNRFNKNTSTKLRIHSQSHVIGKIYGCPVMYLNNTNDSKVRPAVLLSIIPDKEKKYGLILGSSNHEEYHSSKVSLKVSLVPWEMKVRTSSGIITKTSFFDFSRFFRTVNLEILTEFYDGNHETIHLDEKTLSTISTKLNNPIFISLHYNTNHINKINWNIYDCDMLLNEQDKKIKAFLPLCTIRILSHKWREKPTYGFLPTFF